MSDEIEISQLSKYKPEYDEQAAKLCLRGFIDRDLAFFFDVSEKTINNWKERFPSFLQSIKTSKEELDNQVERSLYQKATGYSHPDVDIRTVSVGDGQSEIVQTPIVKHYPPSDVAAIFWLKNRRPKAWRDVWKLEHSGVDGGPIRLEDASADLLRKQLKDAGALDIEGKIIENATV